MVPVYPGVLGKNTGEEDRSAGRDWSSACDGVCSCSNAEDDPAGCDHDPYRQLLSGQRTWKDSGLENCGLEKGKWTGTKKYGSLERSGESLTAPCSPVQSRVDVAVFQRGLYLKEMRVFTCR